MQKKNTRIKMNMWVLSSCSVWPPPLSPTVKGKMTVINTLHIFNVNVTLHKINQYYIS